MDHKLHLIQLLERSLKGEATPSELQELANAVKEDGTGSIQQLVADYVQAAATPAAFLPAAPERWNKLIKNILIADKDSNVTDLPIKTHMIRSWWAAAILILLAGCAVYLWQLTNNQRNVANGTARKNDVIPGKKGAVLTLADGSTIVLDSLNNGVVADQNGTKVLLKDGQLAYNANNAHETGYNTMTTPKGRQFQLVLPDGTKVWLNAASSLRYPTAFNGNERKVEITGEAYFEVTENNAKPFKVKINDQTAIEVLGTRFNINAYNDEASINTTLIQGSVRINAGRQLQMLIPGQQARITAALTGSQPATLKIVPDIDTEAVIAWKNGLFNFQDVSLEEVMRQLERWYNIEVVYEKDIPHIEFGGKISRNVKLSDLLEGLQGAGVHFRMENERKLVVMP